MLIEALTGLGIFIVTGIVNRIGEKTKHKIKGEGIVGVLALIAGSIFFIVNRSQPHLVEELWFFMTSSFGISQGIYMYLIGIWKKRNAQTSEDVNN